MSSVQVRGAHQALLEQRSAAAIEGQERVLADNEQLRSSYRTLSLKYEEQASAHDALLRKLDEQMAALQALENNLEEQRALNRTLAQTIQRQSSRVEAMVPRVLRFAARHPPRAVLDCGWAAWRHRARQGALRRSRAATLRRESLARLQSTAFATWEDGVFPRALRRIALARLLQLKAGVPAVALRTALRAWWRATGDVKQQRGLAFRLGARVDAQVVKNALCSWGRAGKAGTSEDAAGAGSTANAAIVAKAANNDPDDGKPDDAGRGPEARPRGKAARALVFDPDVGVVPADDGAAAAACTAPRGDRHVQTEGGSGQEQGAQTERGALRIPPARPDRRFVSGTCGRLADMLARRAEEACARRVLGAWLRLTPLPPGSPSSPDSAASSAGEDSPAPPEGFAGARFVPVVGRAWATAVAHAGPGSGVGCGITATTEDGDGENAPKAAGALELSRLDTFGGASPAVLHGRRGRARDDGEAGMARDGMLGEIAALTESLRQAGPARRELSKSLLLAQYR
jgi:hypothetical protein